ncbi:MAG: twin-arginine translocase TatA/TatE family subunit [Polyangia bacterium]
MFGLGPTELIVILVLGLVLLGPKKLPDVASGLGKAIRQFRKATRDLTDQLDIDDDVKQPFRELKAALRDEPPPYVSPAPYIAPPAPIQGAVVSAPVPSMTEPELPRPEAGPAVAVSVDAPKPKVG